jgi:carboxyl-terminal processing protease
VTEAAASSKKRTSLIEVRFLFVTFVLPPAKRRSQGCSLHFFLYDPRICLRNTLAGVAVFIGAMLACIGHITARTEMRATDEVCDLVRANYFLPNKADVRAFLERCASESVPFTYTRAEAIKHINDKLSRIRTSHLNIYSPDENRWLWDNEGTDTGIRARMIDSEVVIIATLDGSPARRAQLKAGDVVVAINGEAPLSAQEVQSTEGFYKIARGKTFFQTDLSLEDVKEDLSPQLTDISRSTAILKIPSFLGTYFDRDAWIELAHKLEEHSRVVIDLRGNSGGSFPAMLRALSPFRCNDTSIGRIWRTPRAGSSGAVEMQDDLSAESQLGQLKTSDEIILKTFGKDYGCFKGDAVVLIDSNTASVSEIFAEAMIGHARVWGGLTAGQVVMAQWFPISSLGGGDYAISIPIAGFRAVNGNEIEHDGIRPSRELHYDLETALRGEDSWVNEALTNLR